MRDRIGHFLIRYWYVFIGIGMGLLTPGDLRSVIGSLLFLAGLMAKLDLHASRLNDMNQRVNKLYTLAASRFVNRADEREEK